MKHIILCYKFKRKNNHLWNLCFNWWFIHFHFLFRYTDTYWSTFIVGIVDLGVDLQREITLPNIVSILTFSIIQHKSIHKTENLLTLYIDCPLYFWVLSYSPSPHRFFYAVPEIRAVTTELSHTSSSVLSCVFVMQHFFNNDNRLFNNATFTKPQVPFLSVSCNKGFKIEQRTQAQE